MFYKYEDEHLISGPFVTFPDGVFLSKDTMGEVGMPYEGFYYFESLEEAKNFFGITE